MLGGGTSQSRKRDLQIFSDISTGQLLFRSSICSFKAAAIRRFGPAPQFQILFFKFSQTLFPTAW